MNKLLKIRMVRLVSFLFAGFFLSLKAMGATSPVISPVPNSVIPNSLYSITLMWEDVAVTKGANWTDNADIVITDGEVNSGYSNFQLINSEGGMIYDSDTPGAGIRASFSFIVTPNEPGEGYGLTLNIPEGLINIGEEENQEMTLSYTIVPINGQIIQIPGPTDLCTSLSSFSFKWEYYDAMLNPENEKNITYWGDKTVKSIKQEEDGFIRVDLGETIAENGSITFNIPEGLCLLNTKYGEIPSPETFLTYNIQQYQVIPSDWDTYRGYFDSFIISSDKIELIGEINEIILINPLTFDNEGNGIISNASTYEEIVSVSGNPALNIKFENGFEGEGMVRIIIPANTFIFNDKVYDQEINVNIFVKQPIPDPTADPLNGAELTQLDFISLNWDHSVLYPINSDLIATLTINDGEPININQYVYVVNDEEDSGFGWMNRSNGRIEIDFGDSPYTERGVYNIVIPSGWVTVENYNDINAQILLTYYVDGSSSNIYEISETETNHWEIYNIEGMFVLSTNNKEQIKLLSPGLYIINGKKVWLKK